MNITALMIAAFKRGLADRIAGRPMTVHPDDPDTPEWNDFYVCGYDPRNEMRLAKEGQEVFMRYLVYRLRAASGCVIPDELPYNQCEFPNGKPTPEAPPEPLTLVVTAVNSYPTHVQLLRDIADFWAGGDVPEYLAQRIEKAIKEAK